MAAGDRMIQDQVAESKLLLNRMDIINQRIVSKAWVLSSLHSQGFNIQEELKELAHQIKMAKMLDYAIDKFNKTWIKENIH